MILHGRQRQFVLLVVTGWVAARTATLADWSGAAPPPAPAARHTLARMFAAGAATPDLPPNSASWALPAPAVRRARARQILLASLETGPAEGAPPSPAERTPEATQSSLRPALSPVAAAPVPEAPVRSGEAPFAAHSRWAASAYLFERPGHERSLAAGGELGGSQVAARLTYQLNPGTELRTAAAARVYAPIGSNGAEAAVGLDWHPLPRIPVRLSIERRIALDSLGRNAWSLYTAGGFYAERRGFVLDGYAQAGVVGTKRRDGFVDGALRAGRAVALGGPRLTLGGGLWGAAQPGVERLDAGPRAALSLPVARHSISTAVEGRFRIAGNAHPGSGAALTVGVDF